MAIFYSDMEYDSVKAVEFGLWCTLMARCDKCRTMLDLPHW